MLPLRSACYHSVRTSSKRSFATEAEPAHAQRMGTATDFHPPEAHEQHVLLRDDHVKRIRDFIADRDVLFLTGAGISTESGLPDYRSPRGRYALSADTILSSFLDAIISYFAAILSTNVDLRKFSFFAAILAATSRLRFKNSWDQSIIDRGIGREALQRSICSLERNQMPPTRH
jgi:hypothetical protein